VRTVVQYSVSTPVDYLFHAVDVGPAVRNAVEAELGRQIASRKVDEVLTTEKVAIQEVVRQRSQALVDQYGLGVAISTINIEAVSAPPEAADAFRDVASARADAARIVNEAQGYANDIVPRARGEATQLLEEAQGYKERVVNQAGGDAARFTALAREHDRNPAVTESRLFLETMEEILPRLTKTIVDDNGNLDLTIVRRNKPAAGALEPAKP
jgi:membrane protease subunit HflK